MADIIPTALRYGITEERTWHMTYGELIAEIDAKCLGRKEQERFHDLLNGKRCSIDASLRGIKSCPADYMVTATDSEASPRTKDEVVQQAWGIQ